MTDKNKVYDDFLKSFRIAFANTSVYFKEHPLFLKSVDSFRKNIGALLFLANPLKIGITSDSLLFEKEHLKGGKLYQEIAAIFHRRKVKAIIFRDEVTNQELITFLASVNLSPKDILLKGGLSNVLNEASLEHVACEDLDYSQLLRGEGDEYGDIWLYILRRSLKEEDSEKISELADNFPKLLEGLQIKDLADNEEITKSVGEMFSYLKKKDKKKFFQCARAMAKFVLKNGGQPETAKIDKIRKFLENLNAEDMSNILMEQFQEAKPDSPSLKLLFKLFGRQKHEGVMDSLTKKLNENEELRKNPGVIAGIKELISLPDFSTYESKVYHDNLVSILESITLGEGLCFDRNQLMENYRLVLLDLFVLELSAKRLGVIFDSVVPELNKALAENDLKYLENFRGALDKKKKETPDFKSLFPEVDKKIFDFVEKAIFNEGCTLDLGFLIDILDSSSLEAQFCLDKIFKEGKVNLCILKLFFKFFPDRLSLFYENMDKKISDVRFIEEIMSSLDAIDLNLTAAILKHIFLSANNFIKIKVLEKMEKLHLNDEGFLFSILDKEDFLQCKRALLLLTRSPSARAKAAKILLSIPNPFGLKSRVIERNLELVSEVPFPEARPYLTALSRYKFFWNKNIRIKAQEVLKRHGV